MVAEVESTRRENPSKPVRRSTDRLVRDDSQRLGGLVLARQLGESLMIGDAVTVEVVGLKSQTVRLRIVAPRSVGVYRREVFDAIRLASEPGPDGPARTSSLTPVAGDRDDAASGALVLTRRAGQTIMIGNEVAVDVVEARPGTVRLRVIAPRSIAVHRREVYEAIQSGQRQEERTDGGRVR